MREETKRAIRHTREILASAGCTEAEADLLVQSALTTPPRGASPTEAVVAMGLAIMSVPRAKDGLLEIANLPKEDRERVQEIIAFIKNDLPRFNVGYPHCALELGEALTKLLRGLWTEVHSSCINGALMVSIFDDGVRWSVNHLAIVKAIREMAEADRTMRCGYGR